MSINPPLQGLYLLAYPVSDINVNTSIYNTLGNPPLSYTGSLNRRLAQYASAGINLFRIEATEDYIRISDGTYIY